MQYDLELLEDLITVTLDPEKILIYQPTPAEITEYERIAITEKTRIQKRMKSITGKPAKEQGQTEKIVAQPRFMHIWQSVGDIWKIVKVISYDH